MPVVYQELRELIVRSSETGPYLQATTYSYICQFLIRNHPETIINTDHMLILIAMAIIF